VRKLVTIATNGLVEDAGFDAVDLCEVGVYTERGSAEMVMPSGMAPKRSEGAHERVPIGQASEQ